MPALCSQPAGAVERYPRHGAHIEAGLTDGEYANVGETACLAVGDVASVHRLRVPRIVERARGALSYGLGTAFIGADVAGISRDSGSGTSKAEIGVASSSGLRRPRVTRQYR